MTREDVEESNERETEGVIPQRDVMTTLIPTSEFNNDRNRALDTTSMRGEGR